MINLLKVELYKLKRFQVGYIAILLTFVLGYMYGDKIGKLVLVDTTAEVFAATVSDTSFVFLIALIVALFIGRDFSNRTICNEIKLGYSRLQILFCRMIMACVFAVLFHGAYIISTLLSFSVRRGFDSSVLHTENVVLWLLTVLIQLTAILSSVVLISFATKKLSEAIALSVIYTAICCNILRNYISSKIFTLSCFCFAQDNSAEHLAASAVSAVITMAVFLTIAAFAFRKAEIK